MSNTNRSPGALLNFAREYHQAAEELFNSKSRIEHVKYFLYLHTTELLLKAYLQAHGTKYRGHNLSDLYKKCRDLGLKIEADDRVGIQNIVSLLESGNKAMGFRYFNLKTGPMPDLKWTRGVVGQLREAVTAFVEPNGPSAPGPAVKFEIIIGKPVPKNT